MSQWFLYSTLVNKQCFFSLCGCHSLQAGYYFQRFIGFNFSSWSLTFRLRYKGYFGGVTALTKDQFFQVNGFSNAYWGWGGEDDDLRIRWDLDNTLYICCCSLYASTHTHAVYSSNLPAFVSCRVELQKMKIVRPPADVARYTMVFHKRDSGNEINKDRSVV